MSALRTRLAGGPTRAARPSLNRRPQFTLCRRSPSPVTRVCCGTTARETWAPCRYGFHAGNPRRRPGSWRQDANSTKHHHRDARPPSHQRRASLLPPLRSYAPRSKRDARTPCLGPPRRLGVRRSSQQQCPDSSRHGGSSRAAPAADGHVHAG